MSAAHISTLLSARCLARPNNLRFFKFIFRARSSQQQCKQNAGTVLASKILIMIFPRVLHKVRALK